MRARGGTVYAIYVIVDKRYKQIACLWVNGIYRVRDFGLTVYAKCVIVGYRYKQIA